MRLFEFGILPLCSQLEFEYVCFNILKAYEFSAALCQ